MNQPAYVQVAGFATILISSIPGFRDDVVYRAITEEELNFELAHLPEPYPSISTSRKRASSRSRFR
jgi:hypothetical protein